MHRFTPHLISWSITHGITHEFLDPTPHPNSSVSRTCRAGVTELPMCGTGTSVPDKPEQGLRQAPTGAQTYLCCCIVYYFLCGQITLVPHQQLVDVFTGIAVYLLQPLLDIIERLLRGKRTVSKALDKEGSSALSLWSWPGKSRKHCTYPCDWQPWERTLPWWPQDRLLTTGAIQAPVPSPTQSALPALFPYYFSHILNIQHILPSGAVLPPPIAELRDMAHSWNQMHPTYWQSIRY